MLDKKITIVRNQLQASWHRLRPGIRKTFSKLGLIGLLFLLISQRNISFHFSLGSKSAPPGNEKENKSVQASIIPTTLKWWDQIKEQQPSIEDNLNLANAATALGEALTEDQKKEAAKYSNLGFVLNPGLAKKLGVSTKVVEFKKQKCLSYIQQYAKIAQEEHELFGIPASITLAQALIESNAGDSRLSKNENNHFGIKCKTKCLGCRCANYTDDSQYDMFRIFDSPWYSFREHSKLLTGNRYKHLLKIDVSDYKNWCYGLESAGYATNKQYAETLIAIIEKLELYKYDKK